jgi:hypothetical protein
LIIDNGELIIKGQEIEKGLWLGFGCSKGTDGDDNKK